MRRTASFIGIFMTLLLTCSVYSSETYQQINQQAAAKMMTEEENVIILDVRRQDEFAAPMP